MKNIIIGTAGHVDHGKTTLIKALSGIDTDRLIEEKKRGITIELGFAHIPNDAGYNIGVIDVPGHEKFIKHMLAGIGGIDFVLFVVAADEGIMPQTREHFEILNSLGIDDGIIAVTKTDMVEEEWLEMLLEEVNDYFKGSFLDGKPVIPVSAATGEGIEELRSEIIAKCDRPDKRREEKELFRLPVDRVFTMQGFGTVVTGTLMDGSVKVGDDIIIYPEGTKARVRGIQTYGKDTEVAVAGQRTAINLSGVSKEDIDRGDVAAYQDAVTVTNMIDAEISIFSSTDKVVLNNSRVHLYCGSDEVLCKVILLDRDALSAGETAYAQLRLEEPAAVRRGDRFIIRFYSPVITVGGGRIIDALPVKHKRNRPEILAGMEVLSHGQVSEIIYAKACERRFVRQKELASELGLLGHEMAAAAEDGISSGSLIVLPDDTIVSDSKFIRLKDDTEMIINDYHAGNPLSDGIPRQELLSRLKERWFTDDDRLVQAVLKHLMAQGFIEDRGKSIAISGFSIEYTDEQKALKARIKEMYAGAGIEMIKNDEIFALYKDGRIIRAILEDLESDGVIYKVNPSYYIDKTAWDQAVRVAGSFDDTFTLAEYRDRLGTSRKYAAEFLPAMDKAGVTVFDGEKRRVVK
ncbi:MAG: selenocysteine-specific translation elongation factor [Mogibacterium sp.]|nr:selenocysteine-specific translation elongation factor [Mogibacterium sp.]MBR4089894.1 selenocysteine-specific translation elongation factor [Mogibacterium sp.]